MPKKWRLYSKFYIGLLIAAVPFLNSRYNLNISILPDPIENAKFLSDMSTVGWVLMIWGREAANSVLTMLPPQFGDKFRAFLDKKQDVLQLTPDMEVKDEKTPTATPASPAPGVPN